MRVVVFHPEPSVAADWLRALRSRLPSADVYPHSESDGKVADYGVGWLPPPDFFRSHLQLKAFFCTGAGVERILADVHVPADLPIVRLEDAGMGKQMADYCIFETLRWMLNRDAYDARQREGRWCPLPIETHRHWPVGVFGLGQLGRLIAGAFTGMGFPVNGYARHAQSRPGVACYADSGGAGNFAAFLAATRVLIIAAPLTATTKDRFDRTSLSMLRPASYVINVARGALLVDESLLELLDAGHIAGAALDVFREEPLPRSHPFWNHPRVRITPHVAAVTLVDTSAAQIADKILELERGAPVTGLVDRGRGY
jgi:glyoxylate/hydroxypyruvate reductase A